MAARERGGLQGGSENRCADSYTEGALSSPGATITQHKPDKNATRNQRKFDGGGFHEKPHNMSFVESIGATEIPLRFPEHRGGLSEWASQAHEAKRLVA